jgi:hypothetical protein
MNPHEENTFMKRSHHFVLGTALAALGLGIVFVAAGPAQPPGPEILGKLIAQETKSIDAEMAKTTFSKKGQKRVKMAAFMIAVYAQNAPKGNEQVMATLRDQALKVVAAADAGKADDVKKLTPTLSLSIKADPSVKPGPVALEKHLELELLMRMFSSDKTGGFSMEKALEDLVDLKGLDAAQLEKTSLVGQKIVFMAKMAHAYGPESDQGKKTKKVWNELANEMETTAGEFTAAALAKKDAEVIRLANKLTGTCTKCHDVFR